MLRGAHASDGQSAARTSRGTARARPSRRWGRRPARAVARPAGRAPRAHADAARRAGAAAGGRARRRSSDPPSLVHVRPPRSSTHDTLSRTTVPAGKVVLEFVEKVRTEHNLNASPVRRSRSCLPQDGPARSREQTAALRKAARPVRPLPEHEAKGMHATRTCRAQRNTDGGRRGERRARGGDIDRWNAGELSSRARITGDVGRPRWPGPRACTTGIEGTESFAQDTRSSRPPRVALRAARPRRAGARLGTYRVRARQSGIESEIRRRPGQLREGRTVRWEDFGSKEAAVAARVGRRRPRG